jgi:Ca-activated chloride channel family protein
MIIAFAGPRLSFKHQQISGKGIDIMLAVDVSGSMEAIDFKPKNRLEAAKKVAEYFINKRKNDRIGIVKFAENAFTQCPLTLDYNILMKILSEIKIDKQAQGTAIGLGIATSVARLKNSKAKSKVLILITDGRNNSGNIDPLTAAGLAKTFGIKIYTIGVGKKGYAEIPVKDPIYGKRYQKIKVDVDMDMLNKIAFETGTIKAYRAHNTKELKDIIDNINKMEKTEIKIKNYYRYQDLFSIFIILSICLLLVELWFRLIKQNFLL